MKRILIWGVVLLIFAACAGKKNLVKVTPEIENTEADSLEYELVTFDSRFETWYDLNNSPVLYRSQQFYESWNQIYVSTWNAKPLVSRGSFIYEPAIGYEPGTDYGFELNHRLFYYFQYVENVLKIPILGQAGPRIGLLSN